MKRTVSVTLGLLLVLSIAWAQAPGEPNRGQVVDAPIPHELPPELPTSSPSPEPDGSRVYLPLLLKGARADVVRLSPETPFYECPDTMCKVLTDVSQLTTLPADYLTGRYRDWLKLRFPPEEGQESQALYAPARYFKNLPSNLTTLETEEVTPLTQTVVSPDRPVVHPGRPITFFRLPGSSLELGQRGEVRFGVKVLEETADDPVSLMIYNAVKGGELGAKDMVITHAGDRWWLGYSEWVTPAEGEEPVHQNLLWEPLPVGNELDTEFNLTIDNEAESVTVETDIGAVRTFGLPEAFGDIGALIEYVPEHNTVQWQYILMEGPPSGEWESEPLKNLFSEAGIFFGYIDFYHIDAHNPLFLREVKETFNSRHSIAINPYDLETYGMKKVESQINFAEMNEMDSTLGHFFAAWGGMHDHLRGKTRAEKEAYIQERAQLLGGLPGVDRATVWAEVISYDPETGWAGFVNDALFEEFGPVEAIARGFREVHKVNPDTKLYLSEGLGWGENPHDELPKAEVLNGLLKDLVAQNVPIDGVDIQLSDVNAADPLTKEEVNWLIDTITRGIDQDLDIIFGELLVTTAHLPDDWSQEAKWSRQAEIYRDYLEVALEREEVKGVSFWSAFDNFDLGPTPEGWVPVEDPGLFDQDFQPKPAYWAIREVVSDYLARRQGRPSGI